MISVGIDVSKNESTVCIMKPGGKILKSPFKITHSMEDMNNLASLIKSFDEEVRVVLEDTGHYHLPVISALIKNNIFVCSVNPLKMKKFCNQSIRKVKTDKIDSIKIASYGITYWHELISYQNADSVYIELKQLSRQYYSFTSIIVKAKNNLNNIIDQVMPNINSVLKDNESNNKLSMFLDRYCHYQNIIDMGEKKFIADFEKWSKKQGYRNSPNLAHQIFDMSKCGIPVLPNAHSTKIVVKESVRVLIELLKSRDTILSQMIEIARGLPEFNVIFNMPCLGETLTARIIAEIGDIRRFHSKHALIAYAGIDTPPHQSGSFTATERHITKRGNLYLRKTGFEIMRSIVSHKPDGDPVYEFIEKKRSEGKKSTLSNIAGLNKFLRIYYGRITELYRNLGLA